MTRLYLSVMLLSIFLAACQTSSPGNDAQEVQDSESSVDETVENEEDTGQAPEELALIDQLPENSSADDWNLILINEDNRITDDQAPNLVAIQDGESIHHEIVEAWMEWYNHALENGYSLYVVSGYRDIAHQTANYNNQVATYLNQGDSEEEAIRKTDMYFARPGESEHHTGLAIDLVDHDWLNRGGIDGNILVAEYDTQASQQFLMDTMTDFGFILRYKEGMEEITGVEYEPWHFRYVGSENAAFIEDHNLSLEEYVHLLEMRDQ